MVYITGGGVGNVGPGATTSIEGGKALQQASSIQAVTSPLDGLIKWPSLSSCSCRWHIFSFILMAEFWK